MINMVWYERYALAKAYYEKYHNLDIPGNFITNDGINEVKDGKYNLGRWLRSQRTRFDNIDEEEQQLLLKIGLVKNMHDDRWDMYFNLYLNYYTKYGHSLIPVDFCTFDGIDYDENGYKLGSWVRVQRNKFAKMSMKRKNRLLSNGFVTDVFGSLWNDHFELAKNFFENNGHLYIPLEFCTNDGIHEDKDGFKLGKWLMYSRNKYNELSDSKKEKLCSIGFEKNGFDSLWFKNLLLMKNFYEENHNMRVKCDYVASDDSRLDAWVYKQRLGFDKLSNDKKNLLYENGFIIDFESNKRIVSDLIVCYKLFKAKDYVKLYDLSIQEIQAKIMFLIENDYPLIIDGKLNSIFDISCSELEEKYGISLNELISNYTINVNDTMRLLKK